MNSSKNPDKEREVSRHHTMSVRVCLVVPHYLEKPGNRKYSRIGPEARALLTEGGNTQVHLDSWYFWSPHALVNLVLQFYKSRRISTDFVLAAVTKRVIRFGLWRFRFESHLLSESPSKSDKKSPDKFHNM